MNQRLLELSVKKQGLQMQAAAQRLKMAQQLQTFAPAVGAIQGVQRVGDWVRSQNHLLIVASVVLLLVRPKATLRWARRGFLAWQLLRRARGALQAVIPL